MAQDSSHDHDWQQLRVAEIQDRLIRTSARLGRWTLAPVEGVFCVDAGARRLLGLADEGRLPMGDVFAKVPQAQRSGFLKAVELSCRDGTRFSHRLELPSADLDAENARGRTVELAAEPFAPGTSRVLLAGIVTEAEAGTAAPATAAPPASLAEERLADFIEMADEWLWEMDADLKFTYFSENAMRNETLGAAHLIGQTRGDVATERNEQLETDMHLAWIAQKRPFRDFRYWRSGNDGEEHFVSTSGKPLFDPEGKFLGYRGTGRELTAQQKTQDALIQLNRQLNTANKAKSDAMASLKEANALLEEQNEEMARVQEEIRHKALHDPLTGVGNRRFLDARLAENAARCRVEDEWLGILHIDLDRFKQINDTLGHAAGDAVLTHVAKVLEQAVGPDDLVARVGGDEFVVVRTSKADDAELGKLAQRLIDALGKPFHYDGRECWFGASVGIAAMRGEEIVSDDLLMNADIALYRAKDQGRGCYQYFTNEVQEELVRHKSIADGIRAGLARNEFRPWYQPQVAAATREIIGFEALARWHHPSEGVRPPAMFLDVAEDLNAVPLIDRKILEQCLVDFAEWDAAKLEIPRLSVNVSARRLLDPDLLETLGAIGLERGRLALELLESVFLDDMEDTMVWNIDRLKEMGIEIQLDDFGSGHASIISLVKLGPDAIKIDRQMTAGIALDTTRRDIVGSIIGIGKSLDVRVIAEGVETEDQAAILAEMGCDALQGFLFARPMPGTEVPGFVRSWRKVAEAG